MNYEIIEIVAGSNEIVSSYSDGLCLILEPHPDYFKELVAQNRTNWKVDQRCVLDYDGFAELHAFRKDKNPGTASVITKGNGWTNHEDYVPVDPRCKVSRLEAVFEEHAVETLQHLQVITGLASGIIMLQYCDMLQENPTLQAEKIVYESEWVPEERKVVDAFLSGHGYELYRVGFLTIAMNHR